MALDPHAERVLLVVADAAEFRGSQEIVHGDFVVATLQAGPRTLLHLARLQDVIEVERHIAGKTGDGMADIATHTFVGATVFRRTLGRYVSRQKSQRRVAAVAAGFDTGDFLDFQRMRQRQFEVFDFIPFVGERLGHQGAIILHRDFSMAIGTYLAGFKAIVWQTPLSRRISPERQWDQQQRGSNGQDAPAVYHGFLLICDEHPPIR